MNSVLRQHLTNKYEIFFEDRKKKIEELRIPFIFGYDCDDGWYHILDTLMGAIKHYTKYKGIEPIKINQIKEKFGTLSFYYTGGDDYIHGLVSMASYMSSITCEVCGTTDGVGITTGGWIKHICKDCFDKSDRLSGLIWKPSDNTRIIKIAKLLKKKVK
jgi:hypothetical protein